MSKKLLFILIAWTSFFFSCENTNPPEATTTEEAAASLFANIESDAFYEKIGQPGTVLLDVRTPEETAQGKIEGAVELDFYDDDFDAKLGELDKEKTYLVYCKSGGRSGSTCKKMKEAGFNGAYNLIGGYSDWPYK